MSDADCTPGREPRSIAASFRLSNSNKWWWWIRMVAGWLRVQVVDLVWGLVATHDLVFIHQMNWVNSCNGYGHGDSTTNIILRIVIIIIVVIIIRPHHSITCVHAACCYRLSGVVCRSVCPSVTVVSPAKTAEPIEMPFGLRTWVDPGNHVLHGSPDPHRNGQL